MNTIPSPRPIYYFGFTSTMLIIIPVIIPYFESFGLGMKEVYELNAFFGFSIALCEIPSGYLADLWGRKKSLQIGSFITGASFSMLYWTNSYWDFVLFEIFLGIGFSLISGTDVSLLYDFFKSPQPDTQDHDTQVSNTQALTLEAQRTQAFAHLKFVKMMGESFAALITIGVSFISLSAVVLMQSLCGWLPFITTFWITESPHQSSNSNTPDSPKKPIQHKENWQNIKQIFFQKNKLFRLLFLNYVTWSMATFLSVWVMQKYWQLSDISLVHFGWIWAGLNLVVAVVAKHAFSIQKKLGTTTTFILISILILIGYLGMGLLEGIVGVVMSIAFYVSRGLNMVIVHESLKRK